MAPMAAYFLSKGYDLPFFLSRLSMSDSIRDCRAPFRNSEVFIHTHKYSLSNVRVCQCWLGIFWIKINNEKLLRIHDNMQIKVLFKYLFHCRTVSKWRVILYKKKQKNKWKSKTSDSSSRSRMLLWNAVTECLIATIGVLCKCDGFSCTYTYSRSSVIAIAYTLSIHPFLFFFLLHVFMFISDFQNGPCSQNHRKIAETSREHKELHRLRHKMRKNETNHLAEILL